MIFCRFSEFKVYFAHEVGLNVLSLVFSKEEVLKSSLQNTGWSRKIEPFFRFDLLSKRDLKKNLKISF